MQNKNRKPKGRINGILNGKKINNIKKNRNLDIKAIRVSTELDKKITELTKKPSNINKPFQNKMAPLKIPTKILNQKEPELINIPDPSKNKKKQHRISKKIKKVINNVSDMEGKLLKLLNIKENELKKIKALLERCDECKNCDCDYKKIN